MLIRHGTCGGCQARFTAYDGECLVLRLDPATPKGICKAGECQSGSVCPILRSTANLPPPPTKATASPRLTERDRRVYSALTAEFTSSSIIAARAKLPTRTRSELAEEICSRLARYGLAESAQSRMRRMWRLRGI